jgi:hypothetical protein
MEEVGNFFKENIRNHRRLFHKLYKSILYNNTRSLSWSGPECRSPLKPLDIYVLVHLSVQHSHAMFTGIPLREAHISCITSPPLYP